ncbi:uncharacterized protein LOC120342213 isoform X3 [Styela clava]
MSDSEESSILDNLQKTRELWSNKAEGGSLEFLKPKSTTNKSMKASSQSVENHVNGHEPSEEDIVRFEDKVEDDFDLPDVKSMKSQWEKAGPVPTPKKNSNPVKRSQSYNQNHDPSPDLVPVNREPEEPEEEYEVKLGALREKFESEAKRHSNFKRLRRCRSYKMQKICSKFEGGPMFTSSLTFKLAASAKIVFPDGPRTHVSKAAVDQKKNMSKKHVSTKAKTVTITTTTSKARSSTKTTNKRFETEIEAQRHYQTTKEGPVEMPAVELSSIKNKFEQKKDESLVIPKRSPSTKKTRQTSVSSDHSTTPTDIVRHDDPVEDELNIEVDTKSIRNIFEQGASQQSKSQYRSHNAVQKKVSSDSHVERTRSASDSENVEIVKSSEARYDEMIGEESVKDRLARYKAMMAESSTKGQKPAVKHSYKRRSTTNLVIKEKVIKEEESKPTEETEIIRSPPAGTKETPDYDSTSIGLQQTRELFEQRSSSPSGRSRSSRSSSSSPGRRPPRSKSTPSPILRGSRSGSASSKSPSPVRDGARSSASSSSGRESPQSAKNKSQKKFGDPDVVVLEHSEVNYYYEDGKRLSTKLKGPDNLGENKQEEENMSSVDIVKPPPAGTKEEVDFVPSVDIHSVRDMFEHPQEKRGRSPPKKTIIIEKADSRPQSQMSLSPERNPDIVRSTTAGSREKPIYEMSLDLKSARSKFESPNRVEEYVPRNTVRQREEEARQRRAAAAAASPRTSESSEASSVSDVVKTTEAGSRENPDYQVDLKSTKSLFEGGRVPVPVTTKRETPKKQEVHGEVVRPEPAGTKEIVEINSSKDIKTFKKKFENTETVETEEYKRKDPIDIKEESRMVIQKEKEVKEEVQKSDDEDEAVDEIVTTTTTTTTTTMEKAESSSESETEPTDTEGEAILEHDDDSGNEESREVISETIEERGESVSSEELVEKEEEEEKSEVEVSDQQELEETKEEVYHEESENEEKVPVAAAVIPVRVAITEDLSTKTAEEPESQQEYETYTKVIDYQEEVQQQPQEISSSESENEKGDYETVQVKQEQNGLEEYQSESPLLIEASAENGLKENEETSVEKKVDLTNDSNVGNHLDDSSSSDEQKGISLSSSNLDDSQQQLSLSSSSQQEAGDITAEEEVDYLQ